MTVAGLKRGTSSNATIASARNGTTKCCKVATKYFIESEDTEWSCMSCK